MSAIALEKAEVLACPTFRKATPRWHSAPRWSLFSPLLISPTPAANPPEKWTREFRTVRITDRPLPGSNSAESTRSRRRQIFKLKVMWYGTCSIWVSSVES